jgi:hypothetical protein
MHKRPGKGHMKKVSVFLNTLYIFLLVCGSAYGVNEKTVTVGGASSWRIAENRTSVVEVSSVRPFPVLSLCSSAGSAIAGYSAATGVLGTFVNLTEPALDMSISFNERTPGLFRDSTGRYRVSVSAGIEAADRKFSRVGSGAALFGAYGSGSPLLIEPVRGNALFAPGNRIGDFSIEFWLYPLNLENGEQILSWVASTHADGRLSVQRISCVASRNRLSWNFENFFTSPVDNSTINIEISGDSPVVPKRWSHHLIRFDATTGMVEYLVDGNSERIVYATPNRRENSHVYTPVAGNGGVFALGENFMGLMDEFKIHNIFARRSSIQRYANAGGRIETRAIDLGENNSNILRINASGGRTAINGSRTNNEFRQNGRFRFNDDSEMNFFIRVSDNPYGFFDSTWINFTPGTNLQPGISGRYVQFAVDFYPSADGESSPYLDEVQIVFLPGQAPMPPRNLIAVATDGGVQLRWRENSHNNTTGYLVYYSTVRGELFGEGAALGVSPIDAGKRNTVFINGLKNGTLYYFRVAAYNDIPGTSRIIGEFSREVTARPLSGLTIEN